MRRRARRNSAPPSVVISMSLSVTVPSVGSTRRLMQRMTFDLPAPDGPISAILAVGHVEVDALEREVAGAVALRQPLDPKHSAALRLSAAGLLAGVLDPGRRVDLADHAPVLLIGDRDEAVLVLEFRLERRALPPEREERPLH